MKLFKVKYECKHNSFYGFVVAGNDVEAKRIIEEEISVFDSRIDIISVEEEEISTYPRLICTCPERYCVFE